MISMLVPCYNDNHVVGRAIQSCLNQNFDDYEIIVVDDGSDNPLCIPNNDRIRLIRHRKNKGLSEALNTGARHARGTHLCICSADDELHPNYLSALHPHTKNADIVSCDFIANGRHVRCQQVSLKSLIDGNSHSYAALFSKKVFDENEGFKWYMNPSWEDWEFWLNAAKHGAKWHHVSYPYHKYNRNPIGRDADAQGKGNLLRGKLHGAHQDIYGKGAGVVTVVIPCYKHEEWVNNAIRSCYNQMYPHVNVVVVNDGSMNPRKFSSAIEDDRVFMIHQRNRGLSGARNAGIMKAFSTHSEYLIMLDADDEMDSYFIEDCMAEMSSGHKEYIYTNVQFIGDANHTYECEDYDCLTLARKHIHACTFLAKSSMYKDIIAKREYAYDESMKKGYEDWEFALAVLDNGWCGKRLPEYHFRYRYHVNGSMRIEASKINKELVRMITGKHPWIVNKEVVSKMCTTCGGRSGRYTNTTMRGDVMSVVDIPGIGKVDGNSPVTVIYSGATTSTMTKVGPSGRVYKYSGVSKENNPTFSNEFTGFAKDYNIFAGPQFTMKLIKPIEEIPVPVKVTHVVSPVAQTVQVPEVADPNKITKTAVQLIIEKTMDKAYEPGERLSEMEPDSELPPHDDFTSILGIGPGRNNILHENNIHYYEDVISMNVKELASMIKVGAGEASAIIQSAEEELEKLM